MTTNGDDEKSSSTGVKTDLWNLTLSDEDRRIFLHARGLTPTTSPEEAARIRGMWPDENILMAIGAGLF